MIARNHKLLGILIHGLIVLFCAQTLIADPAEVASKALTPIKGKWDFYWRSFISEQKFRTTEEPTARFALPKRWNSQLLNNQHLTSLGFASYLINMKLKPKTRYSVLVKEAPSAWRFFVDKKLIGSNGKVGRTSEATIAGHGTRVLQFTSSESGLVDFVYEVAGFHHNEGGTWYPIYLAEFDVASRYLQDEGIKISFVLGILLIIAAYHFALYYLRREDKAPLYLSAFCLLIVLRAANTTEINLLARVLPFLDSIWHKRLEFFSLSLCPPTFLAFLSVYHKRLMPLPISVFWIFGWIMTLIVSFTSQRVFGQTLLLLQIAIVLAVIYSCVTVGIATWQGQKNAVVTLVGIIVLFSGVGHDIAIAQGWITGTNYVSSALVLFIFTQAINIASTNADVFRGLEKSKNQITSLNDELNDVIKNLDHKVEVQTRDLIAIVNTVDLGILTISDENLLIDSLHSKALEAIFETKSIQKRHIVDLLFSTSKTEEEVKRNVTLFLTTVIRQPSFSFYANDHLLPEVITLRFRSFWKSLKLTWLMITDENDNIAKILVAISDVTETNEVQQKSQLVLKNQRTLIEIAKAGESNFRIICREFQHIDRFIGNLLKNESSRRRPLIFKKCYEFLSMLKRSAQQFNLNDLAKLAHNAQLSAQKLIVSNDESLRESFQAELSNFREAFSQHQLIFGRMTTSDVQNSTTISVNPHQITVTLRMLSGLSHADNSDDIYEIVDLCCQDLQMLISAPLTRIVAGVEKEVVEITKRLGRRAPKLTCKNSLFAIKRQYQQTISHVFLEIAKNSIEHGYESDEQRLRLSKPLAIQINVNAWHDHEYFFVEIEDDGLGVDLDLIQTRAAEKGFVKVDQVIDSSTLLNFITYPRLSQSKNSNPSEFRGLGFSVIRDLLLSMHAEMQLIPAAGQDIIQFKVKLRFPIYVLDQSYSGRHSKSA